MSGIAEINALLAEIKTFAAGAAGTKQIRLNVMTSKNSKLQMIAHTEGFDAEEVKISLTRGQGCSGKAWNTKAEAITDLSKDVQWISDEDRRRVKRGLAVILSLPLFDPDVPDLKKVIGTITIDSTEPIFENLKKLSPGLMPYVEKMSGLMKKSGL